MPELPESDAARRRIEDHCLNRTIDRFEMGETSHCDVPEGGALRKLVGTRFGTTRRHGKYIFAGTDGGPWLHVHLGMSGSLRVWDAGDEAPDYARITVVFEGDRRLSFRDPRKFGTVAVIDDVDDFIADKGLGPDAMEIGDNAFSQVIGGTRGAVKSALLAQSKLAGVGNLWSDETLYRSGVKPDARACDLEADTIARIYSEMRAVLGGVLDVNADYSRLPDDWLIHHREVGATCPTCGGTIAKKTVGGRTAYHCPDHQS